MVFSISWNWYRQQPTNLATVHRQLQNSSHRWWRQDVDMSYRPIVNLNCIIAMWNYTRSNVCNITKTWTSFFSKFQVVSACLVSFSCKIAKQHIWTATLVVNGAMSDDWQDVILGQNDTLLDQPCHFKGGIRTTFSPDISSLHMVSNKISVALALCSPYYSNHKFRFKFQLAQGEVSAYISPYPIDTRGFITGESLLLLLSGYFFPFLNENIWGRCGQGKGTREQASVRACRPNSWYH